MKRRSDYDPLRQECEGVSPIFLERTLDEAYFPSMDDDFFRTRNKDQVVSKEYRKTMGKDHENAPILIVPQLWLWKMNSVLTTACSNIVPEIALYQPPQPGTIHYERTYDAIPSINLQIGLQIASPINRFGMENAMFKAPLHMFETAVIFTLSDVQSYLDETPGSRTIKEQKKLEQGFIHAISDIHGELDMIQSVLEQQGKVLDALLKDTEKERKETSAPGWRTVERARIQLDEHEKRILKIHRDADRVEKVIESYLSLKRTYATIEDTRNSLMVGFAASAFASVTVIFTPLSFMTGLFALPIDRFARQQANDITTSTSVYRCSYIGGYTGMIDLPKPLT
jgi:hypothetical protein